MATNNEAEVTEEQYRLIKLAMKVGVKKVMAGISFFPTIFVHEADEIRIFSFSPNVSREMPRELIKSAIAEKCKDPVAYALIYYDTAVETDQDEEVDVIIIESADVDDEEAYEFAVKYDREAQTHGEHALLGHIESLFKDS